MGSEEGLCADTQEPDEYLTLMQPKPCQPPHVSNIILTACFYYVEQWHSYPDQSRTFLLEHFWLHCP